MQKEQTQKKYSRKTLLASIFLCSLLCFTVGYSIQNIPPKQHGVSRPAANLYLTVESAMGIQDIPVGNVITNIGENETGKRMGAGGDGYGALKYLSLSNDASADASWTKLPNEATTAGATRAIADNYVEWLYNGNDFAINITKKFTFTGDITLQCIGANYGATPNSDNNLYAAANFAQTAFSIDWNLTARWVFIFDGN